MLTVNQLLSLPEYDTVRDSFRKKAIKAKESRRFEFGPNLTFLFENDFTIQYQIQEMLRLEQKNDEASILDEWNAYKDLLPGKDFVSCTLLIQYPDVSERKVMLSKLTNLALHLKFYNDGIPLTVWWDNRQNLPNKISSVQFLRISIPTGKLRDTKIVSTHPNYSYDQKIPDQVIQAINQDLKE